MTKEVTLMVFQDIVSLDIYIWNDREYPISFNGKSGRQKPWHRMGKQLDEETKTFFNSMAEAKIKKFTYNEQTYEVRKRTKYKYKTHDEADEQRG